LCVALSSEREYQQSDIWLILPELMCLSQRLSHACLSINDLIVKPRMAHYNSYNLLDLDTILLG
jgi:hypothetical protein